MPADHVSFDQCELSPKLAEQDCHFHLSHRVDGLIEMRLIGDESGLRRDEEVSYVRAVLCLESFECFADRLMARPIRLPHGENKPLHPTLA